MKIVLTLTALLTMAACSSSKDPAPYCEPGRVADCHCSDGTPGTMTCSDDGSAWGVCGCAEDLPPTALSEAPPPGEVIQAGFGFLGGTDEVSLAMTALWEDGLRAPATSEEMSAAMAARAQAVEVMESNLPAVRAELLAALESLPADDLDSHISLIPLVQIAGGSTPILDHFEAIAMAELAAEEQAVTHYASDRQLLRGVAMDVLAHHAQNGNAEARSHLLYGVTSPSPHVRSQAVQLFYRVQANRRLAQREMRPLMRPEDRHLLYLY